LTANNVKSLASPSTFRSGAESRQLGSGFGRVEGVEITDVGRKWLADNFPEPG